MAFEVTDEMRAAVIAELRQRAAELAPQGRWAFPGMCGTVTAFGPGEDGQPRPSGLYDEEVTLTKTKAVFTRMLDAAEGVDLYVPSNGSEGRDFMHRFCERCTKDNLNADTGEGGCPIIVNTMMLDVDDDDYPREWRKDGGLVRCTAFEAREPE